jgi:hypothetical protein
MKMPGESGPAWLLPCARKFWGASSGRRSAEALTNINEVVRMIVEEFIEEGTPFPDGPSGDVEAAGISKEEPRIAVAV